MTNVINILFKVGFRERKIQVLSLLIIIFQHKTINKVSKLHTGVGEQQDVGGGCHARRMIQS